MWPLFSCQDKLQISDRIFPKLSTLELYSVILGSPNTDYCQLLFLFLMVAVMPDSLTLNENAKAKSKTDLKCPTLRDLPED